MTDTGDFDGFYRTNYPRVVLSLRLATGSADDAEDLAQEAFARTMVHWARVRGGSSPLGYVYRVAFRLQQRRRLRRKRQHDAASDTARLRSTGLAEAAGDAWSDGGAVREALTHLPPACRRAAALCLWSAHPEGTNENTECPGGTWRARGSPNMDRSEQWSSGARSTPVPRSGQPAGVLTFCPS